MTALPWFGNIITFFESIIRSFDVIVSYIGQGFEIILAYISLPAQAVGTLFRTVQFFPVYIVTPVSAIIGLVVVLRLWKIIISGD